MSSSAALLTYDRTMDRLIIETSTNPAFSELDLSSSSIEAKNWHLAEIQQLITHLKQELEQEEQLIGEQENKLGHYNKNIAQLEEKLKTSRESKRLTLEKDLLQQRQQQEELAAKLAVKRRYFQLQTELMEQYQQMLQVPSELEATKTETQEINDQFVAPNWEEILNPPEKNDSKPKTSWWQWAIAMPILALIVTGITNFSQLQLIGQQVSRSLNKSSSPSQVVSNPQPTPTAIAALGYLEPKGEVIQVSASAMMDGLRVDQLLVKRGDRVKNGQTIAILDNKDRLEAAFNQAKSQVKIAQARLAQITAGAKQGDITAQKSKFQGSIAELQGQINTQRSTIGTLEAQLQGEKSAQIATIERLKAELSNAKTDCQRYEFLFQSGGVAQQSRDSICLKQKTTSEQLQEAQATLKRIVSSRQQQIQEAKANLQRIIDTQKNQISADKATLDAIAQVRPEDIQVAKAELEAAQSATQKAQADLKLAYVKAPKDGQILKINSWPGEMVSRDKGIVELGQTSQMYVTAEVYETDIARVKVGQTAVIKADSVIGQLNGTVDEIGLQIGRKNVLGTDPVADADARVVEVKIRLNSQDSQRVANLTNLQVNVIINPLN